MCTEEYAISHRYYTIRNSTIANYSSAVDLIVFSIRNNASISTAAPQSYFDASQRFKKIIDREFSRYNDVMLKITNRSISIHSKGYIALQEVLEPYVNDFVKDYSNELNGLNVKFNIDVMPLNSETPLNPSYIIIIFFSSLRRKKKIISELYSSAKIANKSRNEKQAKTKAFNRDAKGKMYAKLMEKATLTPEVVPPATEDDVPTAAKNSPTVTAADLPDNISNVKV